MKTWRYALIAILAVVFLGICSLLYFLLADSEFRFYWNRNQDSATSNLTLQNTATYDVSSVRQLKIQYSNMPIDITFVVTDEDTLRIEEFCNKDLEENSTYSVEASGDRLTIERKPKNHSLLRFLPNRLRGTMTVYVPEYLTQTLDTLAVSTVSDIICPDWNDTPQKVILSTTSGTITAPTLLCEQILISKTSGDLILGNASGDIMISTTSGDMRLGNIDGDVNLSSTSGEVSIQTLTGILSVAMTSGSLEVEKMSGDVTVEATSGYIDLGVTDERSHVSVGITSGDVDIRYPLNAAVSFTIDTTSGSIDLPKESTYTQQERRSQKGSFGSNPTSTLTVSSTSGDVDVTIGDE
ncbi:MAG: DUF4097 domain-containing protein [Lachnospiraceae bacterium]|jgi:DUF4097 and DUF4098 domain-containing protein YvlB|nr:DUF4097 domain-containing protein [Lachnospiraceae bacterium]